jgi:hypothetical protein
MAGTVDLELVDLIRNFLYQRGDEGATMNDFVHNVDREDYGAVRCALEYMQDKGETHYKQKMGRVGWYLKDSK